MISSVVLYVTECFSEMLVIKVRLYNVFTRVTLFFSRLNGQVNFKLIDLIFLNCALNTIQEHDMVWIMA